MPYHDARVLRLNGEIKNARLSLKFQNENILLHPTRTGGNWRYIVRVEFRNNDNYPNTRILTRHGNDKRATGKEEQ